VYGILVVERSKVLRFTGRRVNRRFTEMLPSIRQKIGKSYDVETTKRKFRNKRNTLMKYNKLRDEEVNKDEDKK
jgi:hypothetical protein